MKKFLGFICLLYSALIIYVWTSDLLKNFLAPNMQIYIKASVVPLIIMSIVLLFSKSQSHFKFFDLVLFLPLIMILLSSNGRLSETLASNKMINIDNLPINNSEESKVKKEEIIEKENEQVEEPLITSIENIDFDIKDNTYEYLANYFTTKNEALKFEGKTIRVRGFVVTNNFMKEGHFALGKYSISCCAADATFVGFISKYDMSKIKTSGWYEVEGILEKTTWPSGGEILVINVINIKEIPSNDEEEYVYPCYSYDDGTCSDLMKYEL